MGDPDRRRYGHHCVVLNSNRLPLAFIPLKKALKLIVKGKAEILESWTVWRSERAEHHVPKTVVLKDFRQTGARYHGPAVWNQRNLFQRDGHVCQYCRRHVLQLKLGEVLTRDHIIPQSKGGPDTWQNCVTACTTCNHRKDNRSLDELRALYAALEKQLAGLIVPYGAEMAHNGVIIHVEPGQKSKAKQLIKDIEQLRPYMSPVKAFVPSVFDILIKRNSRYEQPEAA